VPDLIPITQRSFGQETVNTVSARDLYAFLGLTSDYSLWITRAIKRANLIENIDFIVFSQVLENPKGGRPAKEHHLTFDAAKHIAMMSSAEKGHAVREYFIAKEKELATLIGNPVDHFPELRAIIELVQSTAQARLIAEKAQSDAIEAKADAAQAHILAQSALETQHYLTIREYVFINKLDRQMPPSTQTAYGRWLAGYCLEHGIPVRRIQVADRQYDTENGYHMGTMDATLHDWLLRRNGQPSLHLIHTQGD
jgi:phage anti-repressor protein